MENLKNKGHHCGSLPCPSMGATYLSCLCAMMELFLKDFIFIQTKWKIFDKNK